MQMNERHLALVGHAATAATATALILSLVLHGVALRFWFPMGAGACLGVVAAVIAICERRLREQKSPTGERG